MTSTFDPERQAGYYIQTCGKILEDTARDVIEDDSRLSSYVEALTQLSAPIRVS